MVKAAQFALLRAFHVVVMAIRVLIYIAVIWAVFPHVAGAVHSTLAPVMVSSETFISEVKPIAPSRSRIWGAAYRRQNCDFVKLKWYAGRRGERRVPVDIKLKFLEKPKIRPRGGMTFGAWDLSLSIVELFNSHADVIHENCRVKIGGQTFNILGKSFTLPEHTLTLYWRVKSHFYDGVAQDENY